MDSKDLGEMKARQGRALQRYDEQGKRLLAGSLPWRVTNEGSRSMDGDVRVDSSFGVEVLLVSSRRGAGMVLPKGGWEIDESVLEAAQRETWEEAGVRGIDYVPIGTFEYRNKLGKVDPELGGKGSCVAHMYACRVLEELSAWPEQETRRRAWCDLDRAKSSLKHPWMREAVQRWEELVLFRNGSETQLIDGKASWKTDGPPLEP